MGRKTYSRYIDEPNFLCNEVSGLLRAQTGKEKLWMQKRGGRKLHPQLRTLPGLKAAPSGEVLVCERAMLLFIRHSGPSCTLTRAMRMPN